MHRLEAALARLDTALAASPRLEEPWRQVVRDRLGDVAAELSDERAVAGDTGLDARADHLHRERNRLLARISVLGPMVDNGDPDAVRTAVARLLQDVHHHHERVNDLAYDAVAMEVGGSE
jgi:uncharacterized protein (DUF2267 family)